MEDGSATFLEGYSRGVPAYFAGPKTFLRAPLAGARAATATVIGLPFAGWSRPHDCETAAAADTPRAAHATR
jgi:hypothetical protein